MAGRKPPGPLADFSRLCAVTPVRDFAGKPAVDASCATTQPDEYKRTVQIVAAPFIAALPAYERDLQKPSREMMRAIASLQAALAKEEQAQTPEVREYIKTHPALALLDMADRVNTFVNKAVTYKTDMDNKGVGEDWQRPSETMKTRVGDCEDYAMLKMALLYKLGFPRDKMWIATGGMMNTVKSDKSYEGHATLVVELGGKPFVLDNFYKSDGAAYGGVVPMGEFYDKLKFAPMALLNKNEVMGTDYQTLLIDYAALITKPEDRPATAVRPTGEGPK